MVFCRICGLAISSALVAIGYFILNPTDYERLGY